MLSRLKINEAGGWVDPAARVRAHCTGGEEAIHRTADLIISYIRVGLHAFYPTTISALGRFFLGLLHVMTMMMVSRASIKRKCLAPWAPPRILYNPSFTFFLNSLPALLYLIYGSSARKLLHRRFFFFSPFFRHDISRPSACNCQPKIRYRRVR